MIKLFAFQTILLEAGWAPELGHPFVEDEHILAARGRAPREISLIGVQVLLESVLVVFLLVLVSQVLLDVGEDYFLVT